MPERWYVTLLINLGYSCAVIGWTVIGMGLLWYALDSPTWQRGALVFGWAALSLAIGQTIKERDA